MIVTRAYLIDLCNKFLEGLINVQVIKDFAWNAIVVNEAEFDDEVVSETIFEWDNEEINYKIDSHNMMLWKKRLESDVDDLFEQNYWNAHIVKQQEICARYHSIWKPINKKLLVGVSKNLNNGPINGLRHSSQKGTTGWFIWAGEYSEEADFFNPMCAEHLLRKRPDIIKYLGLDVGFRFLTDDNTYEDVWRDESIVSIT